MYSIVAHSFARSFARLPIDSFTRITCSYMLGCLFALFSVSFELLLLLFLCHLLLLLGCYLILLVTDHFCKALLLEQNALWKQISKNEESRGDKGRNMED